MLVGVDDQRELEDAGVVSVEDERAEIDGAASLGRELEDVGVGPRDEDAESLVHLRGRDFVEAEVFGCLTLSSSRMRIHFSNAVPVPLHS